MMNSNSNNNNEKKLIKRGEHSGPLFDVDHLATFTVGSKQGLLKAEDGMRKLRIMEKSQGIWTMECQIMITNKHVIAFDKKTNQEVEMFPLDLISDPTSVISDDKKDVYNNILLFTVLEDTRTAGRNATPPEMHIFQCLKTHSADIVDEIFKAKDGCLQLNDKNYSYGQTTAPDNHHQHKNHNLDHQDQNNNFKTTQQQQQQPPKLYQSEIAYQTPAHIEFDVQLLNKCFDDIERFVMRLQHASEYYKELDRRQKQRKSQTVTK
jgi:epidermal growth factor receptor kinase substrate 8